MTRLALLISLVLLSIASADTENRREHRQLTDGDAVLFVGNSLTGTKDNGVPGLTNAALRSVGGPQMNGHRLQIWAQTLKTHWELSETPDAKRFRDGQFKGTSTLLAQGQYKQPFIDRGYVTAREAITMGTPEGKPWQFVVLQCFSGSDSVQNYIEPSGATRAYRGDFFEFASRFAKLVRDQGATPVLYMRTINRRSDYRGGPERWEADARILEQNYHTLGEHLGVDVVPVGEVVHDLTRQPPSGVPEDWLYGDGIHPSPFGRAVWGYTFAAVMTRRSPMDMSIAVSDYEMGKAVGELTITPELDEAIRRRVHETVERYYDLASQEGTAKP